ncbi:putative protein OS=Bosea thiooxidans OX=53254 GN=SAMN05660750_03298 PE=4 SV=1 [Bosea thiooxidans]|uniref:Uncharacterized protein n=1 Tax=Bosea thiooxidans TaxID=53254 RepID=A0A1T5FKE1_9HYPH|nr:hypothetical protein [Bosea thiooxidans]SKB96629.1 hypothetical protein SAMN05660750_03298 [Bosea thiooxidans]
MAEKMKLPDFDRMLYGGLTFLRQPDSLLMTDAMRGKLQAAAEPILVSKSEEAAFRYAGMEILAYPVGTVVLHKRTGQKMVIEENSVLTAIREDVVIALPESRAALQQEPRHDRD